MRFFGVRPEELVVDNGWLRGWDSGRGIRGRFGI